jgi:pantetheine-phosphate adenylyltransferase
MKRAMYPGSFNPWTKGHQNILERALKIFDVVDIVVAKNPDKKLNLLNIVYSLEPLKKQFKDKISIFFTEGLIADFKYPNGIKKNIPIIRGVRSGDWEYEQNLAQWNKILGKDTIFFCPKPENAHISSSALRLLIAKNKNVGRFIGNKEVFTIWSYYNKLNP